MIVFSENGCIEASLPGDDASDFVDALKDALVAIGWAYVSTVTGGHKLEATSRQDLQARLTLVGTTFSGNPVAAMTMMSQDETAVGATFRLRMAADQTYKLLANECQAFVWLPSYSDDDFAGNWDHNWACGIPYVMQTEVNTVPIAGECGVIDNDAVLTEDCWWSCGGGGTSTSAPTTFRWTLTTHKFTSSASWNYNIAAGFGNAHVPRIFPTRHGMTTIGASHDKTQWVNGDPLYLDPYIGWGDALGNHARLRGQLYDAFLASCDQPLEDEVQTMEPQFGGGDDVPVNWINYTHSKLVGTTGEQGSYNGSLYLRRGPVVLTGGAKRNYLYHG